jgi:hypothetical protein
VWKNENKENIREKVEKIHPKPLFRRHFVGMTREKSENVTLLSLKCHSLSTKRETGMTSGKGRG